MTEIGLAASRQRARALIMAGKIRVDRQRIDKPGTLVSVAAEILRVGEDLPYVSRGGVKLEAALYGFGIDPRNLICMDVGASTGGFTDCLLLHGAKKVYAIDVGYGQLAWKLRQDSRISVIERTNIRHMPPEAIPDPVDLATVDVSFISLRIVVPAMLRFLKPGGRVVALIKPQFEVGRGKVGKGGVVRDPALHRSVLEGLSRFFTDTGLDCSAVLDSPILGPKGNREFLIALSCPGP